MRDSWFSVPDFSYIKLLILSLFAPRSKIVPNDFVGVFYYLLHPLYRAETQTLVKCFLEETYDSAQRKKFLYESLLSFQYYIVLWRDPQTLFKKYGCNSILEQSNIENFVQFFLEIGNFSIPRGTLFPITAQIQETGSFDTLLQTIKNDKNNVSQN